MTPVPFALSVHSLVHSIGTDVAFAAIIGLAILILLYFAQARETANLRDRLDNAAQWIEALETRLTQLQRQPPVAPRPAPPAAAAGAGAVGLQRGRQGQPASARPGGGAATPAGSSASARPMRGPLLGAPAGMAGPALAAATHLIPLPGAATAGAAAPAPGAEEELTQVGGPAAVGAGTIESPPAGEATSEDTILAVPAPATAAALANGAGQGGGVSAPPAPRPTFAPGSSAAAPPPSGPARGSTANGPVAAGASAAALTARSGGSRQLPPLRSASPPEPSRARRLVPILIGLALVAVIVVVLLIITHNGSSTTTVHKSRATSAHSKHGKAPAVNPASVTVAVLNGTSVTNLAHDVASRLGTDGYKEGTIATAADQTHSTTIVAYLGGHQADARAVAAVLNLKSSAVQPVDQQAMGVACPGATSTTTSSSCPADVVVTVGSDLAGLASSPSAG